ncbi:MAG: RDD family protein, partial [Isosphaeraceae bacterium]|nr:RDD family protein [Isosphaeraceae bacterium]
RWDAYVAPTGCPLADLAGPEGLPWHEARPILEDLAEELNAACADGTLPKGLTVDQVWIQPDGVAQLVDQLGVASAQGAAPKPGSSDQERALSLLRKAAALALEGGRRRLLDEPNEIRAPVPLHARRMLDRLVGRGDPYREVAAFRDDLIASRDRPREVSRTLRATHLGVSAALLLFGLALMFSIPLLNLIGLFAHPSEGNFSPPQPLSLEARQGAIVSSIVAAGIAALWVVWGGLTRGGLALSLMGLGLVRRDGRRASRLRCAWRALLAWGPLAALLAAAVWARALAPNTALLPWVPFGLAVLLLLASLPMALLDPARGPHDRLSGTYLVPK